MPTSDSIRSGRNEDIGEILERLRPALQRTLVRFQIPEQDAEDILQDTVLQLVTRQPECPEAWLLAGVRYRCLMYWRSRRRCLYRAVDDTLLDLLAGPETSAARDVEIAHDLRKVLPKIPSRCRSLIRLRYSLGLKPDEIAEEMGYRSSSIGTITKRCLAALSRKLLGGGYIKESTA
ncbi:MAG: sigma-70 family RNA polymerase sigma factor [Thermoanaerobaculia bacterium]|nr:sigma-70 family RNA polymerase sigma factor [Thermoanaerobaculia bacterium]